MSRRHLLATGRGQSGGGYVPVDPTDPEQSDYPATSDPILQRLRPTGVRILARSTATPGVEVDDALTPLRTQVDLLTETAYGQSGPDHSSILYLPPATYGGGFGTGRWHSIVGTTGDPADAVIFSDTNAADGVIHPYAPLYMEGVTLKAGYVPGNYDPPKYCAHIAGSARTTFARVIFDSYDSGTGSGSDGSGTVGMDGNPGDVLTFYQCEFIAPMGNISYAMNLHGGAPGNLPVRVMFIDCDAPNGVGYNNGPTGSVPDEMYVIGGNVSKIVAADNTIVYTDLDCPVEGGLSVVRDHTEWPLPDEDKHGFTDFWYDYFYPSGISTPGTTEVRASVTDTAPMSLVAGRTYYCPVPITTAYWFNRFGFYVRSGAGAAFGFRASPDVGNAPHPDIRDNFPTDSTLGNGKLLMAYYDRTWIAYPATPVGGNRMWVAFKMPNPTGVTVDGSAMLPGLHDCYYSDNGGTTLVKASAGTPFPLAHAAQVR